MSLNSFSFTRSTLFSLKIPIQADTARLTEENRIRSCSSTTFSMRRNASGVPWSILSQMAWRSPSWSLAATRSFPSSSCSSS